MLAFVPHKWTLSKCLINMKANVFHRSKLQWCLIVYKNLRASFLFQSVSYARGFSFIHFNSPPLHSTLQPEVDWTVSLSEEATIGSSWENRGAMSSVDHLCIHCSFMNMMILKIQMFKIVFRVCWHTLFDWKPWFMCWSLTRSLP